MSKKKTKEVVNNDDVTVDNFTMDSSYEVINPDNLLDMLSCTLDGEYYVPPISPNRLTKIKGMAAYHESALDFKKNAMLSIFQSTNLLKYSDFEGFIYDYHMFGNAYLEPIYSRMNTVIGYRHVMSKYTRIKKDGSYWFLQNFNNHIELKNVLHFKAYDPNQNIYGMPTYMSALLSVLLNREATLFRYKYYKNGSHAGFILAINGEVKKTNMEKIADNLKKTKNDGNFRNLLVHLPKGDKDSVQLIPISQIATKDEFVNIKDVSRDDILAVHRVPLALMSIQASNAGGFGDLSKIAKVYHMIEMLPVINKLKAANKETGQKIFDFSDFELQ